MVMAMSDEKLLAHALDLSRRGHDEAAGRILTRLAEAGDAEAAVHLGELYTIGYLDCDEPQKIAIRWFEQAARGGNPRGALRYALELDDPEEGDPEAAKPWYDAARKGLERAAAAGDGASQYLLSKMYMYGWGVPEDKPRGVNLMEQASLKGDLEAKFYLGHWYWDLPDRTEEQKTNAIRLWREAAEGGLMSAQYMLGALYASEPDMPIDYEASVRFYRMAVENGNLEALYNLGTMYLNGEGVTKDRAYGIALIVCAAEQGEDLAQSFLKDIYHFGTYVPMDEAEATYWTKRSEAEAEDS
jgi:TPR repeat protein